MNKSVKKYKGPINVRESYDDLTFIYFSFLLSFAYIAVC